MRIALMVVALIAPITSSCSAFRGAPPDPRSPTPGVLHPDPAGEALPGAAGAGECDVAADAAGEGEEVRIGIVRLRVPKSYREEQGTREGTRIWMGADSSRIILSVTTGGQVVISGSNPGGFSSCLLRAGGRPVVATLYHLSHKADSAFIATIERVLGDTLAIGAGVVSRTRAGRARGLGVLKTLQRVGP